MPLNALPKTKSSENVAILPLVKPQSSPTLPFKILHNLVKGRIRLGIPLLRYNIFLKNFLESELEQVPSITNIEIHLVTGSLLLLFEPELLAEEFLIELLIKLLTHFSFSKTFQDETEAEQKEELAWHLLEKDAVLAHWKVDAKTGLEEQILQTYRKQFGPNRIHSFQMRSSSEILREQLTSLPILLLFGSAGISLASAAVVEAGVIMGLIGINAFIGYRTEMSAERSANLLSNTQLTTVCVRRGGIRTQIPPDLLVPGDILALQEAMSIPADARLIETQGLNVDESALTGESVPIVKNARRLKAHAHALADRNNMVYKGTLVTGGRGLAVVVATGAQTELGKIQKLVNLTQNTQTPLQRQTHELTNYLIFGSLALGAAMIGVNLLYGFGIVETMQLSLSMTVAAIPEGLPVLVTMTLAQSANLMRKKNVLVRNLDAIETLGATQILCLDKTGTLTKNMMSVVSFYFDGKEYDWNQEFLKQDFCKNRAFLRFLEIGVLCNETHIVFKNNHSPKLTGSPTEKALIEMALDAGLDVEALRKRFPLVKTDYRTECKSYMQTEHIYGEGKLIAIKGSPTQVLSLCEKELREGKIIPLSDSSRKIIEEENRKLGERALRVLGLAYAKSEEGERIWLGLVAMKDLERPGARELIHSLHEAGIKPVMITGDQCATAAALAHSLGFSKGEKLEVCDFSQIKNLSEEELEKCALKTHVFSRVAPSEKLKIVQILKSKSKIVAMVGDGINDTPALKASHIGVAMGKRGADVARDVSNVVLLDDNVRTLLPAIAQGRTSYDSIKKSILFLLSTNFSETLLMLGAGSLGLGQPLNPMQILWINLISDLFPALALAMEAPQDSVLKRGPHDPNISIMNRKDFGRIGTQAGLMASLALTSFVIGKMRYGNGPRAQTMSFLTLTSAQLLHTLTSRSTEHSVFRGPRLPSNRLLNGSVLLGTLLQFTPLAFPSIRKLFCLAPIRFGDLLLCASLAVLNFIMNEAYKALFCISKNEMPLLETPYDQV